MKQKLITIVATLLLLLMPGGMLSMSASAACASGNDAANQVLNGIDQSQTKDCNGQGVTSAVAAAVNILSLVVGIAAIIMIIISGFRYITSGGASEQVGNAKNTLVYAIIGLIIVALAQFIVHFVLNNANGAVPCPSDSSLSSNDSKCKPQT